MADVIPPEEFITRTRCLLGMPISHAWRGYGSAIFLDFGELVRGDTENPRGESSAMIEWSWRVEKNKTVFFGSFSGKSKLANGLLALVGRQIVDVGVEGRLPELVVSLSGSLWVRSFTTVEGHPEWTLFLPDGNCLSSRLGRVESEPCNKDNSS